MRKSHLLKRLLLLPPPQKIKKIVHSHVKESRFHVFLDNNISQKNASLRYVFSAFFFVLQLHFLPLSPLKERLSPPPCSLFRSGDSLAHDLSIVDRDAPLDLLLAKKTLPPLSLPQNNPKRSGRVQQTRDGFVFVSLQHTVNERPFTELALSFTLLRSAIPTVTFLPRFLAFSR